MRKIFSSILIGFLLSQSFFIYTLIKPISVDNAIITNATATLSNPRRSYIASLDGAHTINSSIITIDSSLGTYGNESSVAGLFPGDTVMVGPNGEETVASIPSTSGDVFIIDGGLNVEVSDDQPVIATQSGTLTVSFTPGSTIPANGLIEIKVPAPNSGTSDDGRPDYISSALNANGFDSNGITTDNVEFSGGNGCTWTGTESFTGNLNTDHIAQQETASPCNTGGTPISVTIGDSSIGLVNPGRFNGTIGVADVYQITINTYTDNSKAILIETQDVSVAVVEGVLVSASVDETLSFTVAGHTGLACGISSTLTTTATTVPWQTLSTDYNTTVENHNASQQLTLSTNSTSGYKVYAQENDQMGLEGNTCTDGLPSSGNYTFGSGTCIRDVTTATHITPVDWGTPGVNYGFGYSLEDVTGTSAQFEYDDVGSTFWAKQFADQEATSPAEEETASGAELMTMSSGPITSDSVYVCFRINIPADQPSGYYYNVLRYTAVPIF